MAELSFVLDIPLMHAIAQASATFIAILAGFYTSKILSIASDKNRLAAKTKEIQNEIAWRRSNALENDRIVNAIDEEDERSYFQTFRDYIVEKSFDHEPSPEELSQELKRYAGEHFSEGLQRILDTHISSILEEIKERRAALFSGEEYIHLPKSEAQMQMDAMYARDKTIDRNELVKESERERDRASFLETQLNDVRREFNSLAFPKYIKFGFVSFVVFAVLGVIFPMTYGIWGEYLLEDNRSLMFLIFHANNFALLLFAIGLALMFIYIGLELSHAVLQKQ